MIWSIVVIIFSRLCALRVSTLVPFIILAETWCILELAMYSAIISQFFFWIFDPHISNQSHDLQDSNGQSHDLQDPNGQSYDLQDPNGQSYDLQDPNDQSYDLLASYPGSRIKGVGGKESLVYTVCACSRFSKNSGKIVFVRILPC